MVLKTTIPGLELRRQRCQIYWLIYLRFAEKTLELGEAHKAGVNTPLGQLERDVGRYRDEIDSHISCCEQCQCWFMSFPATS